MLHTTVCKIEESHPDPALLKEAGRVIREGGLVAFPTETVYGLGGNAFDPDAAKKIYEAKGRPSDNPLIVHIAKTDDLETVASSIPAPAASLAARFWPGPLTIILPKRDKVPLETTGGLPTVAVRFPDHAVARELIREAGGFIAAPSANRSGRPSPTRAEHVLEDLNGRIDMILDSGPVRIGLESTIVDFTEEIPVVLRPGYIGAAALREALGEVTIDPGILSAGDPAVRPKAPGMRYRHYAPEGELIIVEGEPEKVSAYIREKTGQNMAEGKQVGVLCTAETKEQYPEGEVFCFGSRHEEETIAKQLYGALRQFDAKGISVIYSEAFHTPAMGQAIMNRLIKAAGGNVIQL